jgi:hypothetical protein
MPLKHIEVYLCYTKRRKPELVTSTKMLLKNVSSKVF